MKNKFNLILIVLTLFLFVSCSYEPQTHEHVFEGDYFFNENFHWKECDCGFIDKTEHDFKEFYIESTCENMGKKVTKCNDCGYILETENIPALGHNYESVVTVPTCTEQGYTTHKCQCGDTYVDSYVDALGHNYESVVTAPTCTEQGYTTHKCQCGDTYVDSYVDALGHDIEVYPAVAPTCTTSGSTKGEKCSRCDYEVKQIIIEALGHNYQEVITNPTCTTTGYTTFTCTNCQDSYIDNEVSALGHDIIIDEKIDATCTEDGLTEGKHCLRCDYHETQQVVPATGHTGGTATCTNQAVCSTCGNSYGEILEHSFDQMNANPIYKISSATCEQSEIYYYSCICGLHNEETFEYGSPIGHDYIYVSNGDGTHTKSCRNELLVGTTESCSGGTATCDSKAVCELCLEYYGEFIGHNWGNGVITTPATCTSDGFKTYTCSNCSELKNETIEALGHNIVDEIVEPTCIAKGYTVHTCSNECEYSYIDSEVEATGHSWNQEITCENGKECTICQETEEKLGHSYVLDSTTPATCTASEVKIYKCERENCTSEYAESVGSALGHSIENVEAEERQVEDCEYIEVYICNECGEEVLGSKLYNHTYISSITIEATCTTDGVKKSVCEICNHEKFDSIEKNETGHKWIAGLENNGKRTDICEYCETTKVITVVSGNVTDSINTSELVDTEIQLDNANINLGQGVIDSIGNKDITLSADKIEGVDREHIGIDADKLAQVGDNPIYNFTINDGTSNISQFGEDNYVVITLPYVLGENEDLDSIAVWFINDNGELESIKATYNNGYVTFKTNHFSYYTVTRLTPREKCELYGHNYTQEFFIGNCTQDSYVINVCITCHHSYKEITNVALGHIYEQTTIQATCTQSGKHTYNCVNCDYSYEEVINALGHNWEVVSKQSASCNDHGYVNYKCINDGCKKTQKETFPKLTHEFETKVILPTCNDYGYTLYICNNCDYSYKDQIVKALGHSYKDTWVWSDDYSQATLMFVCEHNCEHVEEVSAQVKVKETKATCFENGTIQYTASAKFNGDKYEDVKVVLTDKIVHEDGFRWMSNHNQHWKKCDCGNRIDLELHNFVDDSIITEATCKSEGKKLTVCICGQTRVVEIPKLDNHEYVDNKCIHCGKEEFVCNHDEYICTEYEFTQYGLTNSYIKLYQCACGQNKYADSYMTGSYSYYEEYTNNDGIGYISYIYEFNNGLIYTKTYYLLNEGCQCNQ